MPRPKKAVVDYFPHFVNHGRTLFTLENKFGNDGYSFWFKTLELLGSTEQHYIDCRDMEAWEFLLAKTRVSGEIAIEILDLLAKLGAIDKELWGDQIIWSENFINNLAAVYKRRGVKVFTKADIKDSCLQKPSLSGVYVNNNPQSKVEESKGEDINYTSELAHGPADKKHKSKQESKTSKVVFAENSTEYKLALKLKSCILQHSPRARIPDTQLQSWAKTFDLMMRIDHRTPQEIAQMIQFSTSHSFWHKNILSADSLRKQFDRLILEEKETKHGQGRDKPTGLSGANPPAQPSRWAGLARSASDGSPI